MKKGASIMWLLILAAVIAAMVAGIWYMTVSVGKFGAIKSVSGDKKWLKYFISFLTIAAVFCVLSFLMSAVNAAVIFLNEVMFFLISGGLIKLVTHFSGREFPVNLQGWLAIAFSIVYLLIGYYLCNNVWQKDYNLKTNKNITLKIAMFADSHIGTTFDGEGFEKHLKTMENQNPDILLIPGDFVDDWSEKENMVKACQALGKMKVKYGVWLAYGNHDEGFFSKRDFSAAELDKTLKENGVHVLTDEYELVDNKFYVVGRRDSSIGDRKSIAELLSGVDTDKYIVVLDHEPNDYENESASAADLVVSGHTHGGQLFPITYVGEWFGANDRTYGYEQRRGTDFIVTSGISDWELQFKTGTKSEYVIINVE